MFGGGKSPPEFRQRFIDTVPMRRLVTVEDIANTVAFLVSDVSSAITGQTINVDCGKWEIP